MRSFSRVVLVFGLALLLAVPAMAQQRQRGQGQGQGQGRGRGGFGGIGMLINNEGVQKELKLDAGQIEKAQAAVTKVTEKNPFDFSQLQDLSQEERRAKMATIQQTISAETYKELDSILKPDQIKRLKQIQLQQSGVNAFTTPDVEKALKLDNAQKEKIKTIAGDFGAAQRELFQPGGDFAEMAKKRAALQKETMDKVVSILKDDQKQAWKELVGQPFEVQFTGGRRRGGQ
jgi:hypothetical protein